MCRRSCTRNVGRPISMRNPDLSVSIRSLAACLLLESRRGRQLRKMLLSAAIAIVGTATGIAFPAMISAPPATADPLPCTWCDTPNVQFFASPSGNISCQIDYRRGSSPDSAYCVSFTPPQNVSMNAQGVLSICSGGDSCLSNPPGGEPTLEYGQSKGIGPFVCLSETSGMTCTVASSGRGFTVSSSGIAPVG